MSKRLGYRVPFSERFDKYVKKTSTCWVWIGRVSNGGYGLIANRDGSDLAHRWVYENIVGKIQQGLVLDHECHNKDKTCEGGDSCPHRRCVNPDHLKPVTYLVNSHSTPINRSKRILNASIFSTNKTGFKGVSWFARDSKWRAYIVVNYKQIHLGYFDDIEDAIKARADYEKSMKVIL